MESPPSNEQTLPPGSAPATRWPRLRLAARSLLSLLVGAASILCAVLLVRNGLVPLVDTLFHPDPAALSLVRRIGIFFGALAGYAAYVHWVERRSADELRLQPRRLLMAAGGGALMAGLPITVLFAIGAYQLVELRMASSALWSVAALILIAAMLEELLHRALLFRLLERTLGTGIALVLQALVFAAPHLENLERGSLRRDRPGGVGDHARAAVGSTVRADSQPVDLRGPPRGLELHHPAQRGAAVRHRRLACTDAAAQSPCRSRLADRRPVRPGKFTAADPRRHGRHRGASARCEAAWLPQERTGGRPIKLTCCAQASRRLRSTRWLQPFAAPAYPLIAPSQHKRGISCVDSTRLPGLRLHWLRSRAWRRNRRAPTWMA